MTTPKLARPVKAWAVVRNGKFLCGKRPPKWWLNPGERVARVLITEIPPRARK
jgi:hypothetical protein